MQGLSRARNRGLAASNTDIVAYLDDDCEPEQQWLGILLEPFKNEMVGATTGTVITPQSPPRDLSTAAVRTLSDKDPLWFEIATFGGLGLGGNMALRKSACAGWQVFDERLGRGAPLQIGEETYAFAQLISRGYTAVNLPRAIVHHPPMTRYSIENEARNSFSYWLLLFSAFPDHRADLIRFLSRRLWRKPLSWPREPQEPGDIIKSGWRVYIKAGISGLVLFLRTPKNGL
jgi:glycosyltransferase involved in cell wall biosynthesis